MKSEREGQQKEKSEKGLERGRIIERNGREGWTGGLSRIQRLRMTERERK